MKIRLTGSIQDGREAEHPIEGGRTAERYDALAKIVSIKVSTG